MITFDLTDISIEDLLAQDPHMLALCTPMASISAIPILPTRTCPVRPKLSWHWNVGIKAEIGACRITVGERSQIHPLDPVMLNPNDSIEIYCSLRMVEG